MTKVSCIIPAHNEGPRIEGVLNVVLNNNLISEVIVVNDGSQDNTREVVKKYPRVNLVVLEENHGKSYAVAAGIEHSTGEIIFLLDADLVNLTPQNISELLEPVLAGKADVGVSMRGNAPWFLKKFKLDYLSGDRVFYKKLIEGHLEEIKNLRCFGLEVFLNELIIKNKCRLKVVFWPKVITPLKFKKESFWSGIKDEILMNRDILKTVSLGEVIRQNLKLRALIVK